MNQTTGRASATTSRIRWGRIILAALMSEAGVILVLLASIAGYTLFTPSITDAQSATLGEDIGYYVAPATGAVTTFLAVLWATRRLTSAVVAHGALVGLLSMLLGVGFIFTARPDHRAMYIVAFVLRILGGYAGGLFVQSRVNARSARSAIDQPV